MRRISFFQALVSCLDEVVRRTVAAIVIFGEAGSFHLLQSLALSDLVPDPIADHGHHVTVVGNVGGVAKASMAGNDHGSAFEPELRNGDIEYVVRSHER